MPKQFVDFFMKFGINVVFEIIFDILSSIVDVEGVKTTLKVRGPV